MKSVFVLYKIGKTTLYKARRLSAIKNRVGGYSYIYLLAYREAVPKRVKSRIGGDNICCESRVTLVNVYNYKDCFYM